MRLNAELQLLQNLLFSLGAASTRGLYPPLEQENQVDYYMLSLDTLTCPPARYLTRNDTTIGWHRKWLV